MIYRRDQLPNAPEWSEIDDFETFVLDQGDAANGLRDIAGTDGRQLVVVLSGEVAVYGPKGKFTLKRYDWVEVPVEGFQLSATRTVGGEHIHCEVMRIAGHWDWINVVSIFNFRPDRLLELHYHDSNEYWFIFRGRCTGLLDENELALQQGDMMAIRTGHEHGMLAPTETIEGVALASQLEGQCRKGHLVRELHGVPVPL